MTEERQALRDAEPPREAENEGPTPTPFDHPLFLPVIFAGLTVWFGYDGYLSQDPELLDDLLFNRLGARSLLFGTVWFGIRGVMDLKGRREHPLLFTALLVALSLWLAYDGWLSSSDFNLENAQILRYSCGGVLLIAAWSAYKGAMRMQDKQVPALLLPSIFAGAALWFAYAGWTDASPGPIENVYINRILAATALAVATVVAVRGLRRRGGDDRATPPG